MCGSMDNAAVAIAKKTGLEVPEWGLGKSGQTGASQQNGGSVASSRQSDSLSPSKPALSSAPADPTMSLSIPAAHQASGGSGLYIPV